MSNKYPDYEDQSEVLHEKPRGWYYPVSICKIYESGAITESEFVLLGKINSLCEYYEGCYVSNKALGKWWRKTPTWVSNTLSKFKQLGLVELRYVQLPNKRTRRYIRVTFQGDNLATPLNSTLMTPLKPTLSKCKTSSYLERKNNSDSRTAKSGSCSFGLVKEEEINKDVSATILVQEFHAFLIKHNLHLNHPQLRQGTGERIVKNNKKVLRSWEKSAEDLIFQMEGYGGFVHVQAVLRWWFKHRREDYVPKARVFTKFAKQFETVEQAWAKSTGQDLPKPKEYEIEVIEDDGPGWVDAEPDNN